MKLKMVRLMRRFYGVTIRKQHEVLPQHVLDGIAEGLADFEAGRVITFEKFKRKHPLTTKT